MKGSPLDPELFDGRMIHGANAGSAGSRPNAPPDLPLVQNEAVDFEMG